MHKNLIPILVLLASSTSYAQTTSKKAELPPKPKLESIQKMHDDFLKLKLPPLPVLSAQPNVIYDYMVSVDKVTKDNPSPVRVYSSNGSGTEMNTNYFSNYKETPYIKECISVNGKEPKCSYDNLKTGFGYTLYVSKPYNHLNYEVTIEIGLSDISKWRKFENIELPGMEILNIKKTFAYSLPREKTLEYRFEKKTVVFKSSEYGQNDSGTEYIFTITIEPNYKSKKEIQ